MTAGRLGDYDELLADVIGWTGTEHPEKMKRTVEGVLDGDQGVRGMGGVNRSK